MSLYKLLIAVVFSASEQEVVAETSAESITKLAMQYGGYLLITVAGLLLLAFIKKKSQRGLNPETVRESCLFLKKQLEDALTLKHTAEISSSASPISQTMKDKDKKGWNKNKKETDKEKSRSGVFAQAKLFKLCSAAEESTWCATRLVNEKKDLVFDGIAGSLDSLASELSDCAGNAFVSEEESERCVADALAKTNSILKQIDGIISSRKG